MNTTDLAIWFSAACRQWQDCYEELTHLDSVAGDGDLGITVRAGAAEVMTAMNEIDSVQSIGHLLRSCGAAFARGNPSSFAALTGAGLLAGAKVAGEAVSLDSDQAASCLEAAASKISERGNAQLGDRTVLDALVPSIEALRSAPAGIQVALTTMVEAASTGVKATADMPPAKGRAAWVGERGRGYPDGGATAYLRLLEALLASQSDSPKQI